MHPHRALSAPQPGSPLIVCLHFGFGQPEVHVGQRLAFIVNQMPTRSPNKAFHEMVRKGV
jgi:hypothetical protein